MSTLTIDDILAEVREEGLSEDVTISKEASAQPSPSSDFDIDDVEGMASLLKTATIQEDVVFEQRSMNEKVAEAMILKEVLDDINSPENMFKTAAIEAGYSPEEVEDFMQEKTAKIPMKTYIKAGKYLATGAGAGGLGLYLGDKKGRKTGLKRGRKEGFTVGRTIQNKIDSVRFRNFLNSRRLVNSNG